FLFDMNNSGAVTRLSGRATTGAAFLNSTSGCYLPTISADASMVGFLCQTVTGGLLPDNIVSTPASITSGFIHAYQRSRTSFTGIVMVDTAPGGTAEGSVTLPQLGLSFSADGKLTGYVSSSPNLLRTAGCTPSCQTFTGNQAFIYDSGGAD